MYNQVELNDLHSIIFYFILFRKKKNVQIVDGFQISTELVIQHCRIIRTRKRIQQDAQEFEASKTN